MKFCQNCGAEMPDEGMFCANCGTKVADASTQPVYNNDPQQPVYNNDPQQPVYNNAPQQPVYNNDPQQPVYNNAPQQPGYNYMPQQMAPKPPRKPLSKKAKTTILCCSIAAVVVIIAIICIVIYFKNKKETIDVMDYVTVEFSGYNTMGTAYVNFDDEAFANAVLKAQGKDVPDEDDEDDMDYDDYSDWEDLFEDAMDYEDDMEDIYELIDCIELTVTPDTELSNDDKVTVSVTFDEDIASDNDIILEGDDKEFVVEGLSDIVEVNPFDYIEVTFSGTAPNGSADLSYTDSNAIFDYVWPSLDITYGLSVGDTVTVTISDDQVEAALQSGYKVTQTTQEYTVENLDHYLTKADEMTDETLEAMKNSAEEEIVSYFDDNDGYIGYSDLKYVGTYFIASNETDLWSGWNYEYVVFSASVTSVDDDFEKTTVYLPVEFSDAIEYTDGTQDYYDNYLTIKGSTDLDFGWWSSVSGYTDEKDMYQELITDQTDYTGSVIDDLKDYSSSSADDEKDVEDETDENETTDESDDTEETTTAEE